MQAPTLKEQGQQALLDHYLRTLDLSMFMEHYQAYAKDAARSGLSYERFLLALCEAEVNHRETRRIDRAIAAAKLPFNKEIATYDWSS
jgi:DNA replication protein DnaC